MAGHGEWPAIGIVRIQVRRDTPDLNQWNQLWREWDTGFMMKVKV